MALVCKFALVLFLASPAVAYRDTPKRRSSRGWKHPPAEHGLDQKKIIKEQVLGQMKETAGELKEHGLDQKKIIKEQALGQIKETPGELESQVDVSLHEGAAAHDGGQQQQREGTIYIMGYGSLMKESSRIRSTCNVDLSSNQISALSDLLKDEALKAEKSECMATVRSSQMILVEVEGARRGWYQGGSVAADSGDNVQPSGWAMQGLDISPTYLGAVLDDDARMYAVVYAVTQHELEQTDAREGSYNHLWMDKEKVKRLGSGSFPEDAQFRWYATPPEKTLQVPTQQTPICQSYVDLWLSGALELEAASNVTDYTKNVIRTTYGWSASWVNDRPTPYRPFTREPAARSVASQLLSVARNSTVIVSKDETMQPLTLDILKAVRFPGMALSGLHELYSGANNLGISAVVGLIFALMM